MRRSALLLLLALCGGSGLTTPAPAQERLAVGSKNFTESRLLAEIMAQVIEAHTDLTVKFLLPTASRSCAGAGVASPDPQNKASRSSSARPLMPRSRRASGCAGTIPSWKSRW